MLIIASIGLNATEEKAKKIILAGADVVRFNFSRHSLEDNVKMIKIAHEIITDLHSDIKTFIDLPINKIRLGDFDLKMFAIRENEEFTCKSASFSPDCNQFIPVNTSKLGDKVQLHQTIAVGDGEVAIQVTEIIDSDTIKIRAMNNGVLHYMKTVNIKNRPDDQNINDEYQNILTAVSELDPHYVALSYINGHINEKIKQIPYLKVEKRKNPKIIVKIENQNAVNEIETILRDPFYDIVLIDRGELGVNIPYEQLGTIQKKITSLVKKAKKPIIVSTQILESTINNYVPSRAEILDITNMVLDGVDGILFSRETGINTRPAYTISAAKKIIEKAEKYKKQLNAKD